MRILGLNIHEGKYRDFLEYIRHPLQPTLVFTPNPEILVKASSDSDFYNTLKKADFLIPDANGLYTATLIQEGASYIGALFRTFFLKRNLSKRYGELMRGSTLTKDLVDFACDSGESVLMIDNYRIHKPKNSFEERKMQVQAELSERFQKKFPKLMIEILFDGEKTPEQIAQLIQDKDIRYVFSCIGMKAQEVRLTEIFSHIPDSCKVLGIGVGSSFDYLLGLQKRAPVIFQKAGLEWFYRLLQDPFVRWERIKRALVDFPRLVEQSK
ncbi:MAG: WecB/TagA/CpsF family glycosyltransferase [Candidatus Altimarinota bacterium]